MSAIDAARFQTDLLSWYDKSARDLPWRMPPGSRRRADPYRVWLSEIMLQQTTVTAVIPYFETFTRRWPTVRALADAPEDEVLAAWAGLGYYARARNLIACARTVAKAGGLFPQQETELRALPGVGAYTAAAIAAIAFGEAATVVDGNIERVMARLHTVETPMPRARAELRGHAAVLTPVRRPGDYAQALMDLGAGICRPRAPACLACPVRTHCDAAGNAPERFPVKAAKAPRPARHGIAYWLTHGGDVLLTRRPAKGLLGGMTSFPTSEFQKEMPSPVLAEAPGANWRVLPARVEHEFTHFSLTIAIAQADISGCARPAGLWHPQAELDGAGLPTLFKKVARAGLAALKEEA
jgi:A/G-specific adenine glycosylase